MTTAQDDHHLVRMAVADRTVSSTVLSRHWSTAMGLDLSASTVGCRLEGWTNDSHAIASASFVQRPPMPQMQWARERHHWHAEWQNVVFSDESRFNMTYNDGRICV